MSDDDDGSYEERPMSIFKRRALHNEVSTFQRDGYDNCVYSFAHYDGCRGTLRFANGRAILQYVGTTIKLNGSFGYDMIDGVVWLRGVPRFDNVTLKIKGRDLILMIVGTNLRVEQLYRNMAPPVPHAPAPPPRDVVVLGN